MHPARKPAVYRETNPLQEFDPFIHLASMQIMKKKQQQQQQQRRRVRVKCSPSGDVVDELRATRRGFVPVLVGTGEDEEELQRFMVSVEVLKHPCLVGLLEMAAEEFGYHQKGVLTIPCHPQLFQQLVEEHAIKQTKCFPMPLPHI
ncbi:hypothetical protein Cni_G08262 [Canna indica]|uniref:Uncharacterized protein n=1 Tax=Canna indica TaxID=4628 RepID=A0AAQ3Q7S0_9LILI|nr:hypothetical protein Cni_G08262 [Canna indica]